MPPFFLVFSLLICVLFKSMLGPFNATLFFLISLSVGLSLNATFYFSLLFFVPFKCMWGYIFALSQMPKLVRL